MHLAELQHRRTLPYEFSGQDMSFPSSHTYLPATRFSVSERELARFVLLRLSIKACFSTVGLSSKSKTDLVSSHWLMANGMTLS